MDLPLPEWRQRYKDLIDLGADVIIGHHPHIVQGWEIYKEKPIFYSLGNFYFDSFNGESGFSIIVSLVFNDKTLEKFEIIPIEQVENTVILIKNKKIDEKLDYLCKTLNSDNYPDLIDKQVLWLWENRYKKYYLSLKKFRLFSDNTLNNLLLLHNIRIESHRWSVERALSIQTERNECY